MEFSFFAPRATRDNVPVRKRIQSDALKAYDKYKLEQEQKEAEILKARAEVYKDDASSKSDRSYEEIKCFFDSARRDLGDEDEEDGSQSEFSARTKFSTRMTKFGIFGRCCAKLFVPSVKYELKWKEFISFTICLQVPLYYIVRQIHIMRKWGAMLVLLVYIFMSVTVAMPVFMVCMFMGMYSRKSFVKFWECVPLFKGMAYTVIIMTFMQECHNVAFTSMALMYLKNIVGAPVPWINCNYTNAHPDCVPTFKVHYGFNATCCNNFVDTNCTFLDRQKTLIKHGAKDYYRSHMLQLGYEELPIQTELLWGWILMTEIVWFFIFISLALGLRRIRGIMCTLNICVFILCIPVIVFTIVISSSYSMLPHMSAISFRNLLNYEFWTETTMHAVHRELPGEIIFLSSLARPGVSTSIDTLSIYSVKLLVIMLLTVWVCITISELQTYYKVKNALCIDVNGDVMIYAIVPDILSRWYYPQIWLTLYFSIIFYWGFSSTVYVLLAVIDSLVEEYHVLIKWRLAVCAVICASVGTLNAIFLNPNFMDYYRSRLSSSYIELKVTVLLFNFIGIYLYSERRIKNDYHFMYGFILQNYWSQGIKVATLVIGVLAVVVYSKQVKKSKEAFYVITVVLSPTIIGMVIMTVRYLFHVNKSLLNPDPRWGPAGKKKKLARARFDPTHELRYRSSIQRCKHNCLIYSSEMKKEVKYWINRRNIYGQQVQDGKKLSELIQLKSSKSYHAIK